MNRSNPLDARAWAPSVPEGDAPYYLRLAGAVQAAIRDGVLPEGARLPPQRELAARLRVSVATATAAYDELELRGVVRRHVGRGTFVASPQRPARGGAGVIDLSSNEPPVQAIAPAMRDLLRALIDDVDTADLLRYPSARDAERYAQAAAQWVARTCTGMAGHAARLVPCQGATQGLLAVLRLHGAHSPVVLCEPVTYPGYKVAAQVLGLRLVPVSCDDEGIAPDALADRAGRLKPAAVVVCPALHNPTGATLSLARRHALVDVARRCGLTIVEDDPFSPLLAERERIPAIASLAPELTYYVGSASKTIAPGFRAGWVVPPPDRRHDLAAAVQAMTAAAAPFGCPISTAGATPFGFLAFAKLCETRAADTLLAQVRAEVAARYALARRVIGPWLAEVPLGTPLQAWVPLDAERSERLHGALIGQGIRVTSPATPVIAGPARGVRICLGAARRREQLDEALHVVRGELERAA